jgi:acyl-CoA reductase-like NAD-dependent aldehyde dehydrogenase
VRILDRIAERTGYSLPAVEYALDRFFFSVTEAELIATIRNELGSLEILDGFAKREGRPHAWASPAGSVCIISSRTTVGVALTSAVFALCAKCDVLVKDREDSLVQAFFETLAEELDEFAVAAQAVVWSSNDANAPALQQFDIVVAYGGDDTFSTIRAQLQPQARFIAYGPRASAGYITRESLNAPQMSREIADGAARDLVLYESEGCLSLHVLFVERGASISPEDFTHTLADAVERANVEFPLGRREAETSARLAHQRNLGAFRAATGTGAVFANAAAEYTLVLDPPKEEPPQFLPRALGVIPVDGVAQALAYVSAHRIPLEGFAISSDRADVIEMAIKAGAVRLVRFGELQHPPLGGDHGGRPRIAEFIRWIDKTL